MLSVSMGSQVKLQHLKSVLIPLMFFPVFWSFLKCPGYKQLTSKHSCLDGIVDQKTFKWLCGRLVFCALSLQRSAKPKEEGK